MTPRNVKFPDINDKYRRIDSVSVILNNIG